MKILITRHAEDVGNSYEDKNRGLTDDGKRQAKNLGLVVKNFNPVKIYSSTLKRSKETSQIISQFFDLVPVENKLLDEQFLGRSHDQSFQDSKGFIQLDESYNGGETYQELAVRAKKLVKWLKTEKFKEYRDKNIVLITHGRLMTFLIAELLCFPQTGFFLAIENTAYVIIKISENWRPMLILPIPEEQ